MCVRESCKKIKRQLILFSCLSSFYVTKPLLTGHLQGCLINYDYQKVGVWMDKKCKVYFVEIFPTCVL